jgi:putative tricarboxylic transport membrane protein
MSFNNFDIFLMIGIAVVATILRLYDFPMPPLILAFVLGGLMEENLRRSLLISDGSWSFLWDRPLTICIMITILLIVVWQIFNSFKQINNSSVANISPKK